MSRPNFNTLAAKNPANDVTATEWNSIVRQFRPIFNVMDYGAKGDGVTDDTAAIQATINAAVVNRSGVVFFPIPAVHYLVAGPLVNGLTRDGVTSNPNSQLYIPYVPNTPDAGCISFEGEAPILFSCSESHTTTSFPNTGCLIYSPLQVANANNRPAVFGVEAYNDPLYFTMNFTTVHWNNLIVRTNALNGSGTPVTNYMTAINFENIVSMTVGNGKVDTNALSNQTVKPGDGSFGWVFPHGNNKLFISVYGDILATGYDTGFMVFEHFTAFRVVPFACFRGVVVAGGEVAHPVTINSFGSEGNCYSIVQWGGAEVNIGTYQVERLNLTGRWNNHVADAYFEGKGVADTGHIYFRMGSATKTAQGVENVFRSNDNTRIHIDHWRRGVTPAMTTI